MHKAGWTGTIVQVTNLRSGTPPNEITRDVTVTVNVDHDVATATVHLVGKSIVEGPTVND